MKLTKEEALDLIKIFVHYESLCAEKNVDPVGKNNISVLGDALEEFVLTNEEEEYEDEEVEEDEESDEGDVEEEDYEEDEEDDDSEEESCEDDEEDDESSEEDCDALYADYSLDPAALTELKRISARIVSSSVGEPDDQVKLEFDTYGTNNLLDLLIDKGEIVIGPITYIRRSSDEISFAEENTGERTWHTFGVSKFHPSWTKLIKLGVSNILNEEED